MSSNSPSTSSFARPNVKYETSDLFSGLEQPEINNDSVSPSNSNSSYSQSPSNLAASQPIPRKSAIIKTDRPRPHICTTCTRAFARLEHLKRHERSHTNEKPFQCGACGRCFARRDLVLRHQQKLHASLPSTNRARIRKHNFDHDVQAGDIVQDYLNENINIVYKNTNAKLPLPDENRKDIILEEDEDQDSCQAKKRKITNSRKSSITKTTPHQQPPHSVGNYTASNVPTSPSLDVSPQVMGSLFSGLQQQNSSYQHQHQQPSPLTSNTSPPDKVSLFTSDEISQPILQNTTPVSVTSQPMNHSASEQLTFTATTNNPTTTAKQEFEDHGNLRNRHSSFSAVSASSYTLSKDAKNIQRHDIPEAPHQIGFATPQLSAQELTDRAVMAGFDLDALGIDINDHTNIKQDLKKIEGLFNNSGSDGNRSMTPFDFSITPGGSLLDIPLLQQYLQIGGAGGGAGFESSTSKFVSQGKVEDSSVKNNDINDNSNSNGIDNGTNKLHNNTNITEGSSETKNDWLAEFISTPFDIDFPTASHHIGFTESPPSRDSPFHGTNPDDIPSLFRSRQIDLSKQISSKLEPVNEESVQDGKTGNFFNAGMRNRILKTYHLKANQFPLLEDLNSYMSLYQLEFDKYFPFIHLPSLYANHSYDHLPLLLAMAAIGALYSFHATNSSILAKLSRFLIHEFMSKQKSFNHFSDIPLPVVQGLILDVYLRMFGNETDISKSTSKHLHSVICLAKSSQLNMALENFVLPPPIIDSSTNDDPQQLKSSYEYFILAQSRIRAVHVLYYLSVLFGSLTGNLIELSSVELQSGTPCYFEELWKSGTAHDWHTVLKQKKISIDSKFSLIQISNGESMKDIIQDLEDHYSDRPLSLKTLLTALMTISETIYKERTALQQEPDASLKATKWRMNSRPVIESLLKSWEFLYVKNGGILVPREANLHVINQTPVLKLALPLLSFAKLRKCVYFTPILSNIWAKNWNQMNQQLRFLDADPEALRDGTNYSLDIINLWIEMISISKDAEKTSVRTPIFFVTCIFASILMIGEYLYATEVWARNYLNSHSANSSTNNSPANLFSTVHAASPTLNAIDRVLWLKIQNAMKRVETHLNPNMGSLDNFNTVNDEISKLVLEPSIDLRHTAEIITMAKLSSKSLNVGVRILADAPVWPVALLFAEALKARSSFINGEEHLS